MQLLLNRGYIMIKCKPYYCEHIANGSLCKECLNNKKCKDIKCPVYKYRKGD